MPTRRKIIVYIATSADGYIARKDGRVDWLNRPMPKGSYGMAAFYRSIDTILWGHKTYGVALDHPRDGFDTKIRNYVFSRHPPASQAPGVTFVSEPVADFAKRLRATRGKHIWMMGGAEIIGSFIDANEIDEFIIHVIPTLIGEGIPLIAPRHRDVPLSLLSAKPFSDGVVRLHYLVAGRRGRGS